VADKPEARASLHASRHGLALPGGYQRGGGNAPSLNRTRPAFSSRLRAHAYVQYVKRDYLPAAEHLRHSFELDPDFPKARLYEGLLHFAQKEYDGVIEGLSSSGFTLNIGLLAAAYARKGCGALAEECVQRLRRLAASEYVTPLAEAFAAIGMGYFDLALRRLDQAIDEKTNFVNLLAVEPFFDPIRSDARFATLLERLNLSNKVTYDLTAATREPAEIRVSS
jgi:adenylate cyclase